MLHEDLIINYKKELRNYFLETSFEDVGIINQDKQWFNVKSLQCISGMAQLYSETKDNYLLERTKELFLFILEKQHPDGYYESEVYSSDHQKMRANVIFINIELFNAFELLENEFTSEEKNIFFTTIEKSTKYINTFLTPSKEINQVIAGLLYYQFCKKYQLQSHEKVELYLEVVKALQSKQGFWAEKTEDPCFDGLYGSLSLGYFARCCDFDETLIPYLQKGVEFISHFVKKGTIDLSFSKRWIPDTPQGHRFLVYALSKTNGDFNEYTKLCIESKDYKCSYYVLKSLRENSSQLNLETRNLRIHNLEITKNNNNQLVISALPSRVNGGEITSLYNTEKGWILQQPLIDKNNFPKNCSQVRVSTKNEVFTSYLDNNAIIGDNKAISNLKKEDIKFLHTPFGYYETEKASSNIMLVREYELYENKLKISGKLFYSDKLDNVEVIVPLLSGKVVSKYELQKHSEKSPYGPLTIHTLKIPIVNNEGLLSFKYEIHF